MYVCVVFGADKLLDVDRVSRLRAAQPDSSYRHSTLSFAVRAPVIGVPQARYAVPFVG